MPSAAPDIPMSNDECTFRQIITCQMMRYPRMKVQDLYKLIHQAAMGSEHAISSVDAARSWLEREVMELGEGPEEPVEDVISPDGQIVRINLRPYLGSGGALPALLDAFIQTANEYRGTAQKLRLYGSYAQRMAEEGELPFERAELASFFDRMEAEGFPAVHHSSAYDEAYHPAYRVIFYEHLTPAAGVED